MGNIPGTEFKEYALENDLDEVEALLADHPDLLKWVDENGATVLMTVSEKGLTDIVEAISKFGADLNFQDSKGLTALMYAARKNKAEVCELLIKYGADPTLKNTAKKSAGDLTKEKDLKVMLSKAVEDWNADVAVSEQPVKPKGKGLKAERKTNKPFVATASEMSESGSVDADEIKTPRGNSKYTPKSKRGTPATEKSASKDKKKDKKGCCETPSCLSFACCQQPEDEFGENPSKSCCCSGDTGKKGKKGSKVLFPEEKDKKSSFWKSPNTARSTEKYPSPDEFEFSDNGEGGDEGASGEDSGTSHRIKKLESELKQLHETVRSQQDEIKALSQKQGGRASCTGCSIS